MRTSGNSLFSVSIELSEDELSATTISAMSAECATTVGRNRRSIAAPFQLRITIDTFFIVFIVPFKDSGCYSNDAFSADLS